MRPKDNIIRIALVEDSSEDAEQIVSALRNAGIAVRPTRAENLDRLEHILSTETPDLLIANFDAKRPSFIQCIETLRKGGKDVPVVAVLAALNESAIFEAIRLGADDVTVRSRTDHLIRTVKREFDHLHHRRAARRFESALKETERRCEALLDSSRDPIAYVHEGMHVRANRAYLEIFGYEEFDEIEGMPILDMIAPAATEDFKSLLKRLSKGEKPPAQLEIKAQKMNGSSFDAVMEFSEAIFESEPCTQIVFRQQVGNPELAKQLDELKSQDLVTGLANRAHILMELDASVSEAAKGNSELGFILVEVDNFKSIIDSVGLGQTDLLLSDMAQLLRSQINPQDIAARFSDTTFAILLRGESHAKVLERCDKICKAFPGHIFDAGKQSVSTTISIGCVLVGEKIADAKAILAQASNTLRIAQTEGGNRYISFDAAAQDKADVERERATLNSVKEALTNDGFLLYFQPIISLHGEEREHYEVLLRMKGANGEIPPGQFLPVVDKYNLMPHIDRWVISAAVKSLAERQKAGHKTIFFIKVTPSTLDDAAFISFVANQLKVHRVGGDSIVFEMPESKAVTALKQVRQFVKGLEQLHCKFALEQFGNGLNSFQLLSHVDAQYLKIDRTFMADLAKNKDNQAKVREICTQASSLQKISIAEFVEDAASMSILFSIGVQFVQGNFLQEPEKVMAYEFG